jgi:hypothetical protein
MEYSVLVKLLSFKDQSAKHENRKYFNSEGLYHRPHLDNHILHFKG